MTFKRYSTGFVLALARCVRFEIDAVFSVNKFFIIELLWHRHVS